jgi:hypothetical protein
MGIEFASTAPLYRPALRTLDQSCAGIHTPYHHTYRANEMNACSELGYFLLRLYDSSGKSSSASSTTSTASSTIGMSISDVVMLPSGTGIYLFSFSHSKWIGPFSLCRLIKDCKPFSELPIIVRPQLQTFE